jgi:uncharacterized membrane protein
MRGAADRGEYREAADYSPSTRRRCSSRISSAMLLRESRTSSAAPVIAVVATTVALAAHVRDWVTSSSQATRSRSQSCAWPPVTTLVADAIKDCTRRGDIALDTFCGSGTTHTLLNLAVHWRELAIKMDRLNKNASSYASPRHHQGNGYDRE